MSAQSGQGFKATERIAAPVGGHGDDRIEVAIELVDRAREPPHVRLRQVPLVRRGFHAVDGKCRENLPVAA